MKVNTATDTDLLKVPGLTSPVLTAIKKARPIASVASLHTTLLSVLPATQATAVEKYLSL